MIQFEMPATAGDPPDFCAALAQWQAGTPWTLIDASNPKGGIKVRC